MGGDTPRARALGAELREAREGAGLSVRKLAQALGVHHATVARWETGERSPRPEDVASYLTALGVIGEHLQEIIDLARDTGGARWLGVGIPEQQRQLAALLEFERTATRIVNVSPLLIPGLLQTGDYARAIMTSGEVPTHEIETRVAVRMGRRETLQRRNPTPFLALIGESALQTMIGGTEVMADQLRHLLRLAEVDHVDVRVVPLGSGWNPSLEGPFTLIEFAKASTIVHLEMRRSGLFLHARPDVDAYRIAIDRVLHVALSREESSGLIAREADRMETT